MTGKFQRVLVLIVLFAIALTACVAAPTSPSPTTEATTAVPPSQVPSITSTLDPCAPENLEAEVQKVHKYMREFDDAASLAGSILQGVSKGQMQMSELSAAVPNLQRIRRETEDQQTPACLADLKTSLVNHMYAVINSLNAYLAGNQEAFDQNVILARQQRDQYILQLARALGITPTTVDIGPTLTPTP